MSTENTHGSAARELLEAFVSEARGGYSRKAVLAALVEQYESLPDPDELPPCPQCETGCEFCNWTGKDVYPAPCPDCGGRGVTPPPLAGEGGLRPISADDVSAALDAYVDASTGDFEKDMRAALETFRQRLMRNTNTAPPTLAPSQGTADTSCRYCAGRGTIVVNGIYTVPCDCVLKKSAPERGTAVTDVALAALRAADEVMEMQEKREMGELHIPQPTAKFLWDDARNKIRAALASPAARDESFADDAEAAYRAHIADSANWQGSQHHFHAGWRAALRTHQKVAAAGDDYPINGRVWFRHSTNEWVLELSGAINGTGFITRHVQPASTKPEDVPSLETLYRDSEPLDWSLVATPASILAAEDADNKQMKEVTEYAWVIEAGDTFSPRYLTFDALLGAVFTEVGDHARALRFSRREDAECVAVILDDTPCRIVEHAWSTEIRLRQETPATGDEVEMPAGFWLAMVEPSNPDVVASYYKIETGGAWRRVSGKDANAPVRGAAEDGGGAVADVIAEMISVAAGEYDGAHEDFDPWTAENRATIDKWQCQIADALCGREVKP